MKKQTCFLLCISSLLFEYQPLASINLSALVLTTGFLATRAYDCTVYNEMKEDVIIENSIPTLIPIFSNKVTLSTTTIPAQSSSKISQCNYLEIASSQDINLNTKVVGLNYYEQAAKDHTIFTISKKACTTDCQGAQDKITLKPGLPLSQLSCLDGLSVQELRSVGKHLRNYELQTQ
jgi:hypothetical protein